MQSIPLGISWIYYTTKSVGPWLDDILRTYPSLLLVAGSHRGELIPTFARGNSAVCPPRLRDLQKLRHSPIFLELIIVLSSWISTWNPHMKMMYFNAFARLTLLRLVQLLCVQLISVEHDIFPYNKKFIWIKDDLHGRIIISIISLHSSSVYSSLLSVNCRYWELKARKTQNGRIQSYKQVSCTWKYSVHLIWHTSCQSKERANERKNIVRSYRSVAICLGAFQVWWSLDNNVLKTQFQFCMILNGANI